MDSIENKNRNFDDEINLADIIKVLWKWKKLIIYGVISVTTISLIAVFFLIPKIYSGKAFFQLSNNIFKLTTPEFNKYLPNILDEKKFYKFIEKSNELTIDELKSLKNSLRDINYLDKIISDVKAFPNEENVNVNYIIGVKLSLKGNKPKAIQKTLKLIGEYIKNDIVYNLIVNYINHQLEQTTIDLYNNKKKLLEFNFKLKLLEDKEKYFYKISNKYSKYFNTNNRQIVSVDKDGYRFLSPITQLVGIKSYIADLTTTISTYKHNCEIDAKKVEFFLKSKKLINKYTDSEELLNSLISLNNQMFNIDDKNIKINHQILNDLNTKLYYYNYLYYDTFKFIQQPSISDKPIKPKKKIVVGITFIVSIFIFILISFFLEFLKNNKIIA